MSNNSRGIRRTSFARAALVIYALGGLVLTSAESSAQPACEFEVTVIQAPLCPAFGWPPTTGLGINERGDVVGHYNACVIGPATPFLWTRENGFVTLDLGPGVAAATPASISDNGIIVGTMTVNGLGFRGFVYQNGDVTMLPTVTGEGWSWATAITSDGRYVVGGRSLTDDVSPYNAYIWSVEDGFVDLGVMNGPNSSANDISHTGYVVGWTGVSSFSDDARAFIWKDGRSTVLPSTPTGVNSFLNAVNEIGVGIGGGEADPRKNPKILAQPAIWNGKKWEVLQLQPECDIGGAIDIDNQNTVVGSCSIFGQNGSTRALIWHEETMFELNDLLTLDSGVFVKSGAAISQAGSVLGNGFTFPPDAAVVALLLAPVVPLGDLDSDCIVGVSDLLILLADWGQRDSPADLNGDGIVGVADLLILLVNWG